jgi:hypothetical protein
MNELSDLFKLVAEAKKTDPVAVKTKEIKENIKEDLGSIFGEIASIKQQDPAVQKSKQIKQHIQEVVKDDLGSLFSELAALKKPKEPEVEIVEEVQPIVEEVLVEIAPVIEQPPTVPEIDKYLTGKSFQQPNPDKVDPNIKAIQDKLKFMEQAIGRIAAHGPGSGAGDVISLDHQTTLVTSPTYTVTRKDYYVGVNYAGTVTITLPTNVKNGRYVIIKDESGRCSKFPIIVQGNVDNDAGGFILKIDNGGVQMIYRNGWRIV